MKIENRKEATLGLERPTFGKTQITDSMQLIIGENYVRHGAGVEGDEIKILGIPYLDETNSLRVDILSNNCKTFLFLSDMGISPYRGKNTQWHKYHWVELLNKAAESEK